MGCWDETCAVTNLPIKRKERVVSFFVVNQLADGKMPVNFHGVDALWALVPFPIFGTYDDYGAVENFEGLGADLILDYADKNFFADLGEDGGWKMAKEFEGRPTPNGGEPTYLDKLYQLAHEDKLATSRYDQVPMLVKHIMIKRSFFDAMLATYGRSRYAPDHPSAANGYLLESFATQTLDLDLGLEAIREVFANDEFAFEVLDKVIRETKSTSIKLLARAIEHNGGGYVPRIRLRALLKLPDPKPVLLELLQTAYLLNYLKDARIPIALQTASAQSHARDAQVFRANFTLNLDKELSEEEAAEDAA